MLPTGSPAHVGSQPAQGRARSAATSPAATSLAALGQRLVLDTYGPAAILLNSRQECLYALGPIDRYLQVAAGNATQDILALARDGVRTKLRAALAQASRGDGSAAVDGGRTRRDGIEVPFVIEVRPVSGAGEASQLVCFVERPKHDRPDRRETRGRGSRGEERDNELAAMRLERDEAVRDLEAVSEEQKASKEEALSVNEEYQSTNEELLTSKEELQSLNEELTALNSQLQETLERQRATSNDMQNILYSTDVATLFLDKQLNIRFFTPATRALFKVLPSDVGRPLADLVSLAGDAALLEDARAVLQDLVPVEREIEADGVWFVRRVLPYRTEDNGVEGVVITFTDVTGRKADARALEAAKQEAERANAAKSRFLAAASHDLRQPLQTLSLLQGLLARAVEGEAAKKLLARLDDTLGAMSGMLNTVLDLNQIEAGVVRAEIVRFPLEGVLARLRDEFNYHAQAQGLTLRVVPCSLSIDSDPRLLEQILRNLISNALKYTRRGKVLLGCRRRGAILRIEVWDTGVGIPEDKLQFIFEEYSQLDNAERDRNRGMGLGLSIVRRLCDLLGHKVTVRSRRGWGSVFTIEIPLAPEGAAFPAPMHLPGAVPGGDKRPGEILVVEDDPALRELLELSLRDEGHQVVAAADAASAIDLIAQGATSPDLLLLDYNLPGGLTGVQLAARLREALGAPGPCHGPHR